MAVNLLGSYIDKSDAIRREKFWKVVGLALSGVEGEKVLEETVEESVRIVEEKCHNTRHGTESTDISNNEIYKKLNC